MQERSALKKSDKSLYGARKDEDSQRKWEETRYGIYCTHKYGN